MPDGYFISPNGSYDWEGKPLNDQTKPLGEIGVDTESALIDESTGDAVKDWAKQNGYKISDETLDYLYNQFFTEKNNESAWQRTMEADKTKYQRAVADMKAAGLNPFLLMSNGASGAGTSSAGSVGYGSYSSRKNSQTQAAAQGIGSALGVLGAIIGALIISMA